MSKTTKLTPNKGVKWIDLLLGFVYRKNKKRGRHWNDVYDDVTHKDKSGWEG